jgi:chromosome segregation ATPase
LKSLRYANYDLSSLENKLQKLRNDVIELEFMKKDLNNTITLQRAQLSNLGQGIMRYQSAIDSELYLTTTIISHKLVV